MNDLDDAVFYSIGLVGMWNIVLCKSSISHLFWYCEPPAKSVILPAPSSKVSELMVESSLNVMAHGDTWEGKWRGNWQMELVASTLTLPWNLVYPALLSLMRTSRLPVVDWTVTPADLNGLVRFAERWNLVSACVPSHFKCSLTAVELCHNWSFWSAAMIWKEMSIFNLLFWNTSQSNLPFQTFRIFST